MFFRPNQWPSRRAKTCPGVSKAVVAPRHRLAAAVLAASLCSCDEQESEPVPRDFYTFYEFTAVPWIFDADGRWFLLDIGSPRTRVLPEAFGLPPDTFREEPRPDLSLRGFPTDEEPVLVASRMPANIEAARARGEVPGFAGIVGADILGLQPFAMDPREQRLLFGDVQSQLEGVGAAVDLGARLAGGGATCIEPGQCYEYGPSRMLVDVSINGIEAVALLDTAATYVVLSPSLFDRVERKGGTRRAEIVRRRGDTETRDVRGRVETLVVGNVVEAHDMEVQVTGIDDVALARLQVETGERVEAFVGNAWLQHYVTEVSYPEGFVRVHPYLPDWSGHVVEPDQTFGFQVAESDDGLVVDALIADTPVVENGLELGDSVRRLDGQPVAELEHILDALPPAPQVGDEIQLTVDRDGRSVEITAVMVPYLPKFRP